MGNHKGKNEAEAKPAGGARSEDRAAPRRTEESPPLARTLATTALALAAGFVAGYLLRPSLAPEARETTFRPAAPLPSRGPERLADYLSATAEELESADLAAVNLAAAEGLPGAQEMSREACLATLDAWAERVRSETERNLRQFQANPKEFRDSEAYFRVLTLVTVLQQDLGVRYNKERLRDVNFRDSRDLFIHGLLAGGGGTCVSMPALYTAVGRRLGYPLRLALAKGHVFVRWDDGPGRERFNVEATNAGLNVFDDAHYQTWPEAISAEELAAGYYLKSLSARETLAVFLASRGDCLTDNGRLAEARVAYAEASRLWPQNREHYRALASSCLRGGAFWPGSEPTGTPRRAGGSGATDPLTWPGTPGGRPSVGGPPSWAPQPGPPPTWPGGTARPPGVPQAPQPGARP